MWCPPSVLAFQHVHLVGQYIARKGSKVGEMKSSQKLSWLTSL